MGMAVRGLRVDEDDALVVVDDGGEVDNIRCNVARSWVSSAVAGLIGVEHNCSSEYAHGSGASGDVALPEFAGSWA